MKRFLPLLLLLVWPAPAPAQDRGDLFEAVVETLEEHFHDRAFREQRLPRIASRYRQAAREAPGLQAEKRVVHAFLSDVPATHLALYSEHAEQAMLRELSNQDAPTFGFQLVELERGFFVERVLEGSPAAQAGLLRGDRVMAIDALPPEKSPRLDWRTDDAYLPDPPRHDLIAAEEGDQTVILLERTPGNQLGLRVTAGSWSAWKSAKASARVIQRDGRRLGYVHFWFFHFTGMDRLLGILAQGDFRACDGLVLDMRGRGGSAAAVQVLLGAFRGDRRVWDRPVVCLVDRGSRSAKEVFAWEFQQQGIGLVVGEHTAGAVIPASFQNVGQGMVLMYPAFELPKYTRLLEGTGVTPDVLAEDSLPYSEGADPILEAGVAALLEQLPAREPAASLAR